jgi:hypothetical protein
MKIATLTLAALVAAASPALAEVVRMQADLSPQNEVPPSTSPARGSAEVTLDTATRELTWRVTFSDLSAPLTAMHFHGPALPTTNAGIVVPIAASPAQASIVNGSATVSEAQMSDILAGRYYINIHTPNNPGGELRGQVVRRP